MNNISISRQRFHWLAAILGAPLLLGMHSASAATVTWTNWTVINSTGASGMAGSIDVSFSGAVDTGHSGMGDIGDYSLWAITPATYTGGGVDNSPQEPDLIALNDGSAAGTQTLTFSQAVTNPVMAILSLGGPQQSVEYVFDKPFSILNYGPDAFGACVTQQPQR